MHIEVSLLLICLILFISFFYKDVNISLNKRTGSFIVRLRPKRNERTKHRHIRASYPRKGEQDES